jgi:DNA invertase Pin-like site-specific DNA recombinase
LKSVLLESVTHLGYNVYGIAGSSPDGYGKQKITVCGAAGSCTHVLLPETRNEGRRMKKKRFGYARVSSHEQKEDRQLIALKENGVPETKIYIDRQSGKNFDRPQYQKLLRRLDKNSILFVKSIDRLGRNYSDLNEQWRIITKEKGADIVVLDMPVLDTRRDKNLLGTFISDIVLALLSYVAENERISIRQRQAEGIAAAKARGVKFGRPQVPLPDNFEEVHRKWRAKELTLNQAALACRLPKSTFFDKARAAERR